MAGQESTASQAKSGGSREARASVSLGSAGAGEEKVRHNSHRILDKVPERRGREGGDIARAAGIGGHECPPR